MSREDPAIVARISDVDIDSEVAQRIRSRRRGELTPLDRVVLHSPPIADGWNAMLGAIREQSLVPDDVRELVICRVAVLNGAEYEWAAHAPLALRFGVTQTQLDSLRAGIGAAFDERQQAAVDYATAMTTDVAVSDELFARVRVHFDERQTVELTATVGAYNLVSRFLVALRIEPQEAKEPDASRSA